MRCSADRGGLIYARIPAGRRRRRASPSQPLGPSRGIVYQLAALFSIDAFAGGFAVQSLLALWLFGKFGLSLAAAGAVLLLVGRARGVLLSGRGLARAAHRPGEHDGVHAHPIEPVPDRWRPSRRACEVALALLLVRAALSQMDVPTRSSYVMAVVTPPERAAAASVTSVPRSLAAAASPALAGALFAAGFEAWPLVICGVLKILYDLALLWAFRHIKPPEEQENRV